MSKKDVRAQVEENYKEFAEEVAAATSDELNARLARLAKDVEIVNDEQENDDGLREARETASALGAPYRDSKKAVRLKSRYIIALLKDRGEG